MPRTPFDADLTATAWWLRLKQEAAEKEPDLNPREESGFTRLYFLRHLRTLGIDWGTPAGSSGTGTFEEAQRLLWEPKLSIAVMDASRWDSIVETAAATRLLDNVDDLTGVTRGASGALAIDLPTVMSELLRPLDARAAAETDVARLLKALPDLVQAYRYSDVRGTDIGRLGDVAAALLGRTYTGFLAALGRLTSEAADRYQRLIDKANAVVGLFGEQAQQLRRNTLLVTADHHDLPGLLAGRLARLLFSGSGLGIDEVQQRLSPALSGDHAPGEQTAWAEGVLSGSSLLLLHSLALLKVLDTWMMKLSDESLADVLPTVQRALGGWERPERQALAGKAADLDGTYPVVEEEPDLTELAAVLATVNEILESAR